MDKGESEIMKVKNSSIIYENPLPQLRSRHSFFPNLVELKNGRLAAVFAIGEAFESVDSASCIAFSDDGGKTWSAPKRMFDLGEKESKLTDYCKATALKDGRIVALGYTYLRENPELPIGNPQTGGLLDDFVFYSISEDNGETWSEMKEIKCAWGPHVEASSPIVELQDGTWITPITGFPDWEGKLHSRLCGRALCSKDNGKTWNDDSICMEFENDKVTCYEQRMCQLDSGTIICIGWNEDTQTGERLANHYTVSYDKGKTWSKPESTGIKGQASSLCALGGEKFLALHAVRRDTDRPGVYGYIVDFSKGKWDIEEETLLWEPNTPVIKAAHMAEIFAFLKFGQPSAIKLKDGDLMMSHWFAEDGQYKTVATRIKL